MPPIEYERQRRHILSDLPEFDPDPALWGRIRTANIRRVKLRRVRRAGVVGAIFLGVATIWLLGFPQRLTVPSERISSVNWQMHSQELQDLWSRHSDQNLDPVIQTRLRLLDSDLQAAYDRGAGESELAGLWSLRSQLLHSLVESESVRSRRLTRI